MIRVAIIGPESTGKTTLARALGQAYKTTWVPEYAREYLTLLNRDYHQEDLLKIARGQLRKEYEQQQQARRIIFSDTDLHVIQVWSEHKYGNCDPWIMQQMALQRYDLYILTFYDTPYEKDPLRENPDNRPYFFDWYLRLVKDKGLPYIIVKGSKAERLNQAIAQINPLL